MAAASAALTSSTMRAAVVERFAADGPSVRRCVRVDEQRPVPAAPTGSQLLVRVHASSLNPVDYKWVTGSFAAVPFMPRPEYVAGFDLAGTVEAAGPGCTLRPGDAVYGMQSPFRQGSLAELVLVDEACVARKPPGLTFAEAASLPLVSLTSLQALDDKAGVSRGTRVLVLGASGGTGSAGLQLAAALGASEVAVTCSARNAELMRGLGATRVVDYRTENWWEVLAGEAYDVVYDCVGGYDAWRRCAAVLRPGGRFVTIVGDRQDPVGLARISTTVAGFVNRKFWSFFGGPNYTFFSTNNRRADQLDRLAAWVESGRVRPVVDKVYPLAELGDAFDHIVGGHTVGKVVVAVSDRAGERE